MRIVKWISFSLMDFRFRFCFGFASSREIRKAVNTFLGFLANWQPKISNSFVTFGSSSPRQTHAICRFPLSVRASARGTNMTARAFALQRFNNFPAIHGGGRQAFWGA